MTSLLKADLFYSDITRDLQGVDFFQWLQTMVVLHQVLVVDSNLEFVFLCKYDHVKAVIRHEGKIWAVCLLTSPATAHERIPHENVNLAANAEACVTMQSDVTTVIGTAHQVDGESFCIGI